jgi:hypothetical protein
MALAMVGTVADDQDIPPLPPRTHLLFPDRWLGGYGPGPLTTVVSDLAQAANLAQLAATLPEGEQRSRLETSVTRNMDAVLDEYCGTRPPWPGPPPAALMIASAPSELANTYQTGFLREELLRIAGLALRKTAADAP